MSIESFIQAMPKVELNLHLEGALDRETLLMIAEQNDIPESFKHFKQWVALLDNPDYKRVDEIVRTVSQWLQQTEDLTRLVYEMGVGLAKQNVRYAEVCVNPALFMDQIGVTFEQFLGAINDGRDRVERGWQVQLVWILDVSRDQPRKADDVVRWATGGAAKKGGIVGIGLRGTENAQPVAQFERAFHTAQKKGVPTVIHAGEMGGAEEILEIIHSLQPNRIIDGWGTADAPDIVQLLTQNQITLDVWMAKALCEGRIPSYSAYPLRDLYDQGIRLTISSGMPSLFKTSITAEYLAAVEHCGFTVGELEEFALNAIHASLLSDDARQEMLKEFTAEYLRLREAHQVTPDTVAQ